MRRYYVFIITLVFLIALPFSVKAQYELPEDTTQITWEGSDHPIMVDNPHFLVYYIDTVGWKLTFDTRTVTLLEDEDTVPVVDSLFSLLFGEPLLEPVTKTIIMAHGRADAATTKIRQWRVRIGETP